MGFIIINLNEMKKIYIIFSILFFVTGCYKDLSTGIIDPIPDIVFGNEESIYVISYGDVLYIDPQISQEGRNQEDLSYLWEIDLTPDSRMNRLEISNEPVLEYQVGSNPSDQAYNLTLKVTDRQTDYTAMKSWKIYVGSALGEGLAVAYTQDGGLTSDIDFVASPAVTYGYDISSGDVTYVRGLFSLGNGAKYNGRINTLCPNAASNGSAWNLSRMLVGTDNELFSLNPQSYKRELESADFFPIGSESSYSVSEIFNYANYIGGAIINNSLYTMVCNSSDIYTKVNYSLVPSNIFTPENTAYAKPDQGSVCVFDNIHEGFYYIRGWMSASGALSKANITTSFPLSTSESIACGSLRDKNLAFVIKTATGEYYLSKFDLNNNEPVYTEFQLIDRNANDSFDTVEELDNAVSFAFCDNADLFYFATPEHIYANLLVGNSINTRLVPWEPESSDEKITKILQYHQAWYGTRQLGDSNYDFINDTHQMQLLIVTYNESTGEGKIYLREFILNTGYFSTAGDNGVFDGFGEITAITPTFR